MGWTRGSLALPRMTAHRLVIIAAALTTMVAAALATALAGFSGQGLPHAVRHDLGTASGTSIVISGSVDASQAAQYTAQLPGQISRALQGTPYVFYRARWSDPLGFVPGAEPAGPASSANTLITEAGTLDDITGNATLVSGTWPGAPSAGQPIPAALPASAAALLHVVTGEVLRLKDRVSGHDDRFVVTGLYRPRQVSADYWGLDNVALSGSSTVGGFTTYGPLTVQAAAFAGPLAVDQGSWLAQPHTASVPAGELTTVAGSVQLLQQSVQDAQNLPDLTLTTSLPSVLNGTASNVDVARSLLAICAVLIFLLAAAALLAVARLLTGQREGESAMLAARGATRWQLLRLTTAEAIPLALVSSAVGAALGVLLARLLGTGGVPVNDVWPAAAAVAAGAIVIMAVPALSTVTPGTARARRGRQAAISGVTRAGGDLALVLLAVVAGWQLRHYSAVSPGAGGNYSVDPVIVAAPALALAGGTVAALRLLPAGGKAGERLAVRGRRLTAALASWQISRQPIRQGGAALLIVLAVATGTLALSQRASWTGSDHDQAAFDAGADARVQPLSPLSAAQAAALAQAPGVRHAMPVASFPQSSTGAQTLALDATQAADIVLLRPDQSALAEPALFGKISPAGVTGQAGVTGPAGGTGATGPAAGVTLPGGTAGYDLVARLGPAALGLAPAQVTVSVQDADGNVYQLGAGTLPADGRAHTLAVSLSGGARGAIYPLRLTAIGLDYTLPASRPRGAATLTVVGVSGEPGTTAIPGTAMLGWSALASSTELAGARQTNGTAGPAAAPDVFSARGPAGPGSHGPLTVTFATGYGLASSGISGAPPFPIASQLTLTIPARTAALPGLATRRFLAATNSSVGSTVQTSINGASVSVKIVAALATFPTVTGGGGGLIVDLGTLQHLLTVSSLAPAQATQWWLATSAGVAGLPAGLTASLPPGSAVTSAGGVASELLGNPLSTVPQQALLAIAIAAALLAITGFCVSIAAGVRQRRAENALLAALGVPPRAAATQLCLEKLMLSLPSALAGLVLGVVLTELLVPAITLTSAATTPVPPVRIQFSWAQTLPLALAVAVLPVLAAGLTIVRRPDAAAALRAAEAA
jgi:ABC-type antimicrobial peptide transport system permease subunit